MEAMKATQRASLSGVRQTLTAAQTEHFGPLTAVLREDSAIPTLPGDEGEIEELLSDAMFMSYRMFAQV